MKTAPLKTLQEYEERIVYLENKLNNIMGILEKAGKGDSGKPTKSEALCNTSSKDFSIISNLINKAIGDKTFEFLRIVIENIPFPVFIKDEHGKYLLVNCLEAELFNLSEEEIIGKHDNEFLQNSEEIKIVKETDDQVLLEKKSVELPAQNFTLTDGRFYIFKTQKIPFENPLTGKTNIWGFSVDVTDSVNLDKLKKVVLRTTNPFC